MFINGSKASSAAEVNVAVASIDHCRENHLRKRRARDYFPPRPPMPLLTDCIATNLGPKSVRSYLQESVEDVLVSDTTTRRVPFGIACPE